MTPQEAAVAMEASAWPYEEPFEGQLLGDHTHGEYVSYLERCKLQTRGEICFQENAAQTSEDRELTLCWVQEYDLLCWRLRDEIRAESEVPF